MNPYACPNCHNKMRFHICEQNPVSVKLDPQSGEVMANIDQGDPMAHPYKGESRLVECAICGQSGTETLFIKTAQRL